MQAVTAARVAYCAAVLKLRAEPLLEHLAEQQHQLLAEQAEQVERLISQSIQLMQQRQPYADHFVYVLYMICRPMSFIC